MANSDKLLSMDEALEFLSIKKPTLYNLCMRKEITFVKIGKLNRFRMSDLADFIDKRIVRKVN